MERFKKYRSVILIGLVLGAAQFYSPEANAQSIPSVEQPSTPTPSPLFTVPDSINTHRELTRTQKPLPLNPAFRPMPETNYSEPKDHDLIITWTATEMGISEKAVRKLIMCESEFNPKAVNPVTGARGWWQIMPEHTPEFELRNWNYELDSLNPYRNSVVAVEIKRKQGLSAWSCKI